MEHPVRRRTEVLDISYGWATNLIAELVLVAWIPMRELPGLGTLLNVAIVGFAADAAGFVLPVPDTLRLQVGYLGGGLVAIAFFDALYLGAQFGSGPRDGIMTGLTRITKQPIAVVRTGIEVVVAGVGWLLGGTLGIGTVVVALLMGPLVGFFLPRVAVQLTVRSTTEIGHDQGFALGIREESAMNFWDVLLGVWMVFMVLVGVRVIYVFVRHRPFKDGTSSPSGTAGSNSSGSGSGDEHSWFDGWSDSGGGGGCGGGGGN